VRLFEAIGWRVAVIERSLRLAAGLPDIQWMRVVMHRETSRFVSKLPLSEMSALEVSGKHWQNTPFRSYLSLDYPAFDICGEPHPAGFDIVIAEQVLEHVLSPRRAIENVYQMLNPGGIFIVNTPFLVRIHDHPIDCTRWSERGLRQLLYECRSSEIETGSWGNRRCARANFRSWVPYRPWHSLKK